MLGSAHREEALLMRSQDDYRDWELVPLFRGSREVDRPLFDIVERQGESGSVVSVAMSSGWLESLSKNETKREIGSMLESFSVPTNLVVNAKIESDLKELKKRSSRHFKAEEAKKMSFEFSKIVEESVTRQESALRNVRKLSEHHLAAIRDSDPIREGGQVATRIAIVGLLIFLIQIFSNRFRYHLRLSKFYQARGKALRLVVAHLLAGYPVKESSIAEISSALSPDGIGFDKSVSPAPLIVAPVSDERVRRK